LLAAALVFAFAACRGDSDNGPSSSETPDGSDASASPTRDARSSGDGEALDTEEIVERLSPSVVQVVTEGAALNVFGELEPSRGIGTGVVIDDDGRIVTNDHVIRLDGETLASEISVTLSDGRTVDATVVGSDQQTDIAVIDIDATSLTPAELGDEASLPVGSDVVAIGFALGLEGGPSVTRGVVSAKSRSIQESVTTIPDAIQTDASINPGNSGGPLVDERGRVVGINTAIALGAQNIGFAISIDLAKPIIDELIADGQVARGYLGVTSTDVTPARAAQLDLPVERGVGVVTVAPGSPADEAGLQPNDIMVGIGQEEIENLGHVLEALRRYGPGERVTVRFYRGEELRETEVTLAERPDA
jgi:S1-C subfamily serine protease